MARREFEPGAKVKRFEARLSDPKPAIKQIGFLMVSESQNAFKAQKFGKHFWEPRGVPNRFGVLADFDQGRKVPPKRRFDQRPALRDTGRLVSSISWIAIDRNALEVGSRLPYAGVLHAGGEVESVKITKSIQQKLKDWLSKKGDEWREFFQHYLDEKWIGKKDEMEVPKRPIVGVTKQTLADVKEAVGTKIFEIN